MNVELITMWYNEEFLAPFFLNHYSWVDKIHLILDADTNDRTEEIARSYPNVVIEPFKFPDMLDDNIMLEKFNQTYRSLTDCDYVMLASADEFVFCNELSKPVKQHIEDTKKDIYIAHLWTIYDNEHEKPLDTKVPVWEQRVHGDPDDTSWKSDFFHKPLLMKSNLDLHWGLGCHGLFYRKSTQPNFTRIYWDKRDKIVYDNLNISIDPNDLLQGAHWHLVDLPQTIIRRVKNRKERLSQYNKTHGLGIQFFDVTPEKIVQEYMAHKNDPIVIKNCTGDYTPRKETPMVPETTAEDLEIVKSEKNFPPQTTENFLQVVDGSQMTFADMSFLITSHTEGKHRGIQEKLLIDLVNSFKKYFPGCYVIVASASDVPEAIKKTADYIHIEKSTPLPPPALHGNGELALIKAGLDKLYSEQRDWVYKFTYDFIIDERNKDMIYEWFKVAKTRNKSFVGTTWVDIKGSQWDVAFQQGTVGTWLYYGNVQFLKKMFDNMNLDNIIERKVTQYFTENKLWDQVYLYPSANDMLNKTWEKCGDLVTDAGKRLKPGIFEKEIIRATAVKSNRKTILCSLCTKDRYFTTLPMAISSIALQTRVPDKLIIYDDGEHKNLNDVSLYTHLFSTLLRKGCFIWLDWASQGRGMHFNDQRANKEGFDLVWRFDDDEVAEHDTLERLEKYFLDDKEGKLGAVGGAVVDPRCSEGMATGKIEFIYSEPNFQWFHGQNNHKMELEHLHGSFLYRAGIADFNLDLSPVSHRGETMFTMELRRKGYKLFSDQGIATWHYRETGGIRSHQTDRQFLFDHDEKIFMNYLESWGYRICVLDNGIGDHMIFVGSILPELQKRWKHLIIACCYPECFEGKMRAGDSLISIGDAPNPARLALDVYTHINDGTLKGSLQDAFRQLYLGEK